MRLGILSDTHDELARARLAIQMLRDAGDLVEIRHQSKM